MYDYLAPLYDPVFHAIYEPFRRRALDMLPLREGDTVLDLACGTGQNFPHLAPRLGPRGRILGVDISEGMLRRAAGYAAEQKHCSIRLLQADVTEAEVDGLDGMEGLRFGMVDVVVCTYGFSSIPAWRQAFANSLRLLRPGGTYLIHDFHAQRRNPHSAFVELVTRINLAEQYWQPLRDSGEITDFELHVTPHTWPIFGGNIFTATGKKRGQPIPQ